MDLEEPSVKEYVENMTGVVLEVGLQTGRDELLFTLIYEKYVECKAQAVFLQALTPFIISGSLKTSLNAAVANAFIEFKLNSGEVALVEEILMQLHPMVLDLNFVIRVCKKHQLYSGLIYVFTQAFKDYVSPAVELLKIIRQLLELKAKHPEWIQNPESMGEETKKLSSFGYRLFVYLVFTWTGKAFPSGLIDEADQSQAKANLYQFIFSETFSQGEAVIKQELPFPYLRLLLLFDATELMRVLSAAFEDECLDDRIPMWPLTVDLGSPETPKTQRPYFNRQVLVDILLRLIINPLSDFSNEIKGALFIFIARNLSRHQTKLSVTPTTFQATLQFLTSSGDASSWKERQLALLELLRVYKTSTVEEERLLMLCENAGFFKVCEAIYRRSKKYHKIIQCYIKDEQRKGDVFQCIRDLLSSPELDEEAIGRVKKVAVTSIPDLIKIDGTETANLVLEKFSEEHANVLEQLEAFPQLQYQYLKGFLNPGSAKKNDRHQDTPEIQEKFIELMCQIEPSAVYKYLQMTENYRLEKVLQLCEKYRVTDAIVFLLERMGDVSGALLLILEAIQERVKSLSTGNFGTERRLQSSLAKIAGLVRAAVQLCQRNSHRMEEDKCENLWFSLLDTIMVPQRKITSSSSSTPNIAPNHLAQIEEGFRGFIQTILSSMMGYVALANILNKILQEHSSAHFWEYKEIIFGILENYNYEDTLLQTTNRLLARDRFVSTHELVKLKRKGKTPSLKRCDLCGTSLMASNLRQQESIASFNCGHVFHTICMKGSHCVICSTAEMDAAAKGGKGKKRAIEQVQAS